ncbi:hypothetical protein M2158_004667 [Streptomyces sp. SAI-144]|uniref:hypothetical protein n=1 Tax=unclassified Streptomyces TaxID=2593676 RepID=UPI0024755647|nr:MULTISPECIES: hypothetical protein [unclassified Streptomyces]MDH6436127.1 hypothetical protein [Streptomyces sp. SAI-144]MDH6493537.1 hypothetical protein [Streptomyces sp. SAI-127]
MVTAVVLIAGVVHLRDARLDLGRAAVASGIRILQPLSGGVAAGDGVVAGVGVAAELGRVGGFRDRVGGQEAAGGGVVFARAEVLQAGRGVGGAADVSLVAGPGARGGATGLAEAQVLAAGDLERLVVDGERVGALPVRDEVLDVAGAGPFRDDRAAGGVVAGAGD